MRQIILSSSGAALARVPRPSVAPGSVVVKVHYSLISTGTELAPLRVSSGDGDATTNPHSLGNLARRAPELIVKAVRNPRLALRRAHGLSQHALNAARTRLVPLKPVAPTTALALPSDGIALALGETAPLVWRVDHARSIVDENGRTIIAADPKPSLYQARSQAIAVGSGQALKIALKGSAKGAAFILGVLSADQKSWLQQRALEDDFDETLVIAAPAEPFLTLALFLADAVEANEVRLELETAEASPTAMPAAGENASDMHTIGWGVGYSAAGEVVAVGDGVRGIKIGDLVACGGAGQANHAEYIAVKQNLVARIPQACPVKLAATTTVGAIALQGVRRADPKLGETIAVVGLGLLGLMTCAMLKANGCRVLGLDPSEDRARRAKALGVDEVATTPERFLDIVQHRTAGHGADATIITAATKSDALINHAMKTTRRKGRVVIVGDVGLSMDRADLYRKEIDVLISSSYGPGRYDPAYEVEGIDYPYAYVRWTQNRNMQAYLDLVAQGALDIDSLIDEVVPVADAPAAYKRLASDTMSAPVGVVIAYPAADGSAAEKSDEPAHTVLLRGAKGPKPGRLRYVLVGAGAFGQSMLVPQMDKRKDRFDLRGVVSRDAVRGGNFARERQLPILASDLGEVVTRDDIDLVVIATRHDQHAAQAAQALRAGKHVFVEKPLALTWDELDLVREAYETRPDGGLLMVGFNRRFAPAAEALRQALADRTGPLIISYRLNGGFIPGESWIQGKEGGGRNLGEACHMYDFFRSLTGAPVAGVSASSIDPRASAYRVNDNFVATLTYADGSLATLTYTANGPKTGLAKERIEVFCDGKAYVLDNFTSLSEYPADAMLWQSGEGDKGHFTELSRFGDLIAEGASDGPIPFADIVETTAVSLHIEDLLQGRI